MARNTGVLPNQIVGALGACIFYTSLQQALIRGRALSYSKNYSPANMIKKLRWRVAINFTKLVHPWLAYVMPAIIAKQNRNSKITGIFMKMINNIGLFDETKNTTFFFGNGAIVNNTITAIVNIAGRAWYIKYANVTPPAGMNTATTTARVIIFNQNLTKLWVSHITRPFSVGFLSENYDPMFITGEQIYIFLQLYDPGQSPVLYTPFSSMYPLTSYTILA
jgi:hypothetical protein